MLRAFMSESKNTSFVITVLGEDKPGIVEALAAAVAEHGGNWIESRMARLAGQFAGIVQVESKPNRAGELREAVQQLPGLSVTVGEDSGQNDALGKIVGLELIGPDRPGIVRELSHAFAAKGVNVEELETECVSAPMTGEPLFKASARLAVPESTSVDDLREDLDTIATELTLDIDLADS